MMKFDANILVVNSYCHPYLGTRASVGLPGFYAKSLTITIVCGNNSRIFPRNFLACLAHVLTKVDFEQFSSE